MFSGLIPAKQRHRPNVVLMLGQRRRRGPTLNQHWVNNIEITLQEMLAQRSLHLGHRRRCWSGFGAALVQCRITWLACLM